MADLISTRNIFIHKLTSLTSAASFDKLFARRYDTAESNNSCTRITRNS
jgi:hypothetical protein